LFKEIEKEIKNHENTIRETNRLINSNIHF